MRQRFALALSVAILGLPGSAALAQRIDLGEARRTVLDHSAHQLSALESVVDKVPPHAQGGITEAIRANETSRNDALAALDRAQRGHISNEEGVSRAYDAVERGTRKHTEVLTGLLDKVPEEAKPAIERALVVSQTGRRTALGNLSAIQQGQKPTGVFAGAGPASVSRPGGIDKPEDSAIVPGAGRKAEAPFGGRPGGVGNPSIPGKVGGPIGGGGGGIGGGRPGR